MKNDENGYALRVPYPAPTLPEGASGQAFLARLHGMASGREGELTTICSYLYNALCCRRMGEERLAGIFDAVARTEMVHLRLLGEMILCCGGDPAYFAPGSGHKIWWSGSFVPYSRDPARMVRTALAGEQAACAAYRALLPSLPAEARPCIERILADEQHHVELFRSCLPAAPTGRSRGSVKRA